MASRNEAKNFLKKRGINPTFLLADALNLSPRLEWEAVTEQWERTREQVRNGGFDNTNLFHLELAYGEYLADPTPGNPIERGNFLKIARGESTFEEIFTGGLENYAAEADFFAYEALNLAGFIDDLRGNARGYKIRAFANRKYGAFIADAIKDHLEDRLMELEYTYVHSDEKFHPNAFTQDQAREIMRDNDAIVIIDIGRNTYAQFQDRRAARYSRSHLGFLKFFAAVNIALMGDSQDIQISDSLRSDKNFQRVVRVLEREAGPDRTPYRIGFWNPHGRQAESSGAFYDCFRPEMLRPRTIVFATTSVLHEMLPDALRRLHPEVKHDPNYFNDNYDMGEADRIAKVANLKSTYLLDSFMHIAGMQKPEASRFTLADRVKVIEPIVYS